MKQIIRATDGQTWRGRASSRSSTLYGIRKLRLSKDQVGGQEGLFGHFGGQHSIQLSYGCAAGLAGPPASFDTGMRTHTGTAVALNRPPSGHGTGVHLRTHPHMFASCQVQRSGGVVAVSSVTSAIFIR
jgi:hypothetical protein